MGSAGELINFAEEGRNGLKKKIDVLKKRKKILVKTDKQGSAKISDLQVSYERGDTAVPGI